MSSWLSLALTTALLQPGSFPIQHAAERLFRYFGSFRCATRTITHQEASNSDVKLFWAPWHYFYQQVLVMVEIMVGLSGNLRSLLIFRSDGSADGITFDAVYLASDCHDEKARIVKVWTRRAAILIVLSTLGTVCQIHWLSGLFWVCGMLKLYEEYC